MTAEDLHEALTEFDRRARDLFICAGVATGRGGEAGELLLYLLTEWNLEAPQIVREDEIED